MKQTLRSIAAFYLGASLSIFANSNISEWKFWVIVLPVILLFNASDDIED